MRSWATGLALALLLTIPSATASQPPLPARLDPDVLTSISPRAIVVFDHNISDSDIGRLVEAGITHAAVFEVIDSVAVSGPRSAYIDIARWYDVVSVEDDSPVKWHNYVARRDTGVDDVRAKKGSLKAGYTGKGVTVAVVDSGVDTTHPDLRNIALSVNMEPAWFMDDVTGENSYSQNYAEQPVGTDEFGHGTHVAGIVGGTGEMGQNVDQTGVAPEATLINIKIGITPTAVGGAFETDALAAYDWILKHRRDKRFPGGIEVATNSWGLGDDPNPPGPLVQMLEEVVRRGVTVVFSAGNSGPGPDTVIEYPNQMEEVITVGAICKSDASGGTCGPGEIASFSSRGPEVDVAAPGVNVWSTKSNASALGHTGWLALTGPRPGDPDPVAATANMAWYMPLSGTSMSAPHVAGVVALMVDANPNLSPARIEAILTKTATDAGEAGFDPDYGFGVVDALAAVRAAERAK